MEMIDRKIKPSINNSLSYFPVTALLGPRQVGKTTLAKAICKDQDRATVYLDLERPSDLAKLDDAETYLSLHKDKLVCLDEIQRKPDLFPLLRSLVDESRRPGQFLVLGSASPELLRQSSETLAGRISYIHVQPFSFDEMKAARGAEPLFQRALWRGGFPDSFLAPSDQLSASWRDNFITTFLERDLAQMGINVSSHEMRRLWLMCAHSHGQLANYSKLGQSLDMTHPTVKKHIDHLCATFMLRLLMPCEANTKKRLVKAPKVYVQDAGIFCSLMEIGGFDDLYSHPAYGSVWEGFAINSILTKYPEAKQHGFFRTHSGDEIDLLMKIKGKMFAFEFKVGSATKVSEKLIAYLDILGCEKLYVIVPDLKEAYPVLKGRATVISLADFLQAETP